jgi:hypothetical protein
MLNQYDHHLGSNKPSSSCSTFLKGVVFLFFLLKTKEDIKILF